MQGEPRNFDKVSMFSRNILLAKCMRKTPDIPLCYFHQRDVVDSLFKRRFVLQTLFAHYAGLQQYLHDVAHNPGIVSLLQVTPRSSPCLLTLPAWPPLLSRLQTSGNT